MKKLLFLFFTLLLFSCNQVEKEPAPFEVGDIVYYKLDSTKCIVTGVDRSSKKIKVEYKESYFDGKITLNIKEVSKRWELYHK